MILLNKGFKNHKSSSSKLVNIAIFVNKCVWPIGIMETPSLQRVKNIMR